MNLINSAARNTEALVDLLENILVRYQDNDSRPERSLSLYRKWVQLSANYRVRIVKGLVVVEGRAKFNSPMRRKRRQRRGFAKSHLQLIRKVEPLEFLP